MKNLKKFIATILATTLTLGCVGSMNTFAGEPDDWCSPTSAGSLERVSSRAGEIHKHHHRRRKKPEEVPTVVKLDSSGDLPVDEGFGLPLEEREWLEKYNFVNVDTESCIGCPADMSDLPGINEITISPAKYYSFMKTVPDHIKTAWRKNPGLMSIFSEFLESTNLTQTLGTLVGRFDSIEIGKVKPETIEMFEMFYDVIEMGLHEQIIPDEISRTIETLTNLNQTGFTINPAFIWFALSCLVFYAGNIPGDDSGIITKNLFDATCRFYDWPTP